MWCLYIRLVDLAALKSYAPSGLSEDMVKYLETVS